MNGLLSKLTVTPLLYAVGFLLLANIGQSVWLWQRGVELKSVKADAHVAEQNFSTSERHVTELESARKGWEETANKATAIIAKMQSDATDLALANASAIAAAETAQAAAEQRASSYRSKFNVESRKPDCAHALAALENACPALKGY